MIAKIRSTWIVLVIFFQKIIDNVHRLIFGLPRLKRSQITAEVFLGSQYNKVGLKKLKTGCYRYCKYAHPFCLSQCPVQRV
jgi:hypothetical protein